MSIIHPGKVSAQDPEITLNNYSDGNRTRFLFNGTQFVKARVSNIYPTFAYVGTVLDSGEELVYDSYKQYKDSDGSYVLINGSKYIPQATGAPEENSSHAITIGFSSQVTTDSIYFWSTSYIDENIFNIKYSYDDEHYFDVSSITVTYSYDDTLQRYEGESPASGLYEYEISLENIYTARYFRISTYNSTTTTVETTSPTETTISVLDTSGFMDSCSDFNHYLVSTIFIIDEPNVVVSIPFTYSGKTSTAFTGISMDWSNVEIIEGDVETEVTPYNWSRLEEGGTVYSAFSFGDTVTEVEPVRNLLPALEVWDTDGTEASTKLLEKTGYFDLIYDKHYDTYIAVRNNIDFYGTPGSGYSLGDNFDYTESEIDTIRWDEDSTNTGYQSNTTSGTLECWTSNTKGQITTNYYMSGDFTADIALGFNSFGEGATTELRAIENTYNNLHTKIGYRGEWVSGGDAGNWEATSARETSNTSGDKAHINGLRLDNRFVDSGSTYLNFSYNLTDNLWTVTSGGGGELGSFGPGENFSEGPLDNVSVVHSGTPTDGSTISIRLIRITGSAPATSPWGWRLGLKADTDDLICRYDSGTGNFVDWVTFYEAEGNNYSLELFTNNNNTTSDLTLDNFVASGTGIWSSIPVLSIETLDVNGNNQQVVGLSDSDGFVIKELDVLNIPSSYSSWTQGKVQIATDHSSGGSIFVKVLDDLYKYDKATLPLASDDGSTASLFAEEVLPTILDYNFEYNSYSEAGLCYVEYDVGRDGYYLYSLNTNTLAETSYQVLLDLPEDNLPLAWDISDFSSLYFVDDTDLKFFKLDPDSVAFCNLAGDEKIMSAGTGDSIDIRAAVLNPYGEPLESKTVAFSVSSGDGSISPDSGCSTASGIVTAVYTVGSTVGITEITATASDISCS